jgi:hypothetical protein
MPKARSVCGLFLFLLCCVSVAMAGDCAYPSDCQATTGYLTIMSVLGGLAALLAGLTITPAQRMWTFLDPAGWKAFFNNQVQNIFARQAEENPHTLCNVFATQALQSIYDIHDFDVKGDFKSADEIANCVDESPLWQKLGPAGDQKTLDKARELATAGQATIAVGNGHIVLIKPGEGTFDSPNWGSQVPYTSAMAKDRPGGVGPDIPLSKGWTDATGVTIYVRRY